MAKRKPEFPTDWHQDRYIEDLDREVLGYRRRLEELDGLPDADKAVADAQSGLDSALSELKRLGRGQEAAAKRPRKAAEKT